MENNKRHVDLFYPGYLGSKNYRIPAIMTTIKNTVIASIDARILNGNDSPNDIDSAVRRSLDGGNNWGEGKIILDYPEEASAIDTCLVQHRETQRIFLLVTHFPTGYGYPQAQMGNGYLGNTSNIILRDKNNNEYVVKEEGRIYDKDNTLTDYVMDEDKNIYEKGIRIDNALTSTSPLKVLGTSYLHLIYSDDDGVSWSAPRDLNPEVKEQWMKFMGAAPGRGIQIKNGQYVGRLILPIYYTNVNGNQSSTVIYSDDNGETWARGKSPNDGRIVEENVELNSKDMNNIKYELTECQVIEMPDGSLKLFMRNRSGHVAIATSFNGGESWNKYVDIDENLNDPYCQLSVINYSKKIDEKDALIFSNANSSARENGTVRIGLIDEDGIYENGQIKYSIDWKYSKLVKPGYYAYSCLTELPNGNIGLFYEGTEVSEMSYVELSIDDIKNN